MKILITTPFFSNLGGSELETIHTANTFSSFKKVDEVVVYVHGEFDLKFSEGIFINKKITNPTIQSFLDYIPYTVLAAMTFPDIFYSTGHLISGIVATIIIIYASYKELSLIQVACIGCFIVVMIELIL